MVTRQISVQPEVTINVVINNSRASTSLASPTIVFLHYWGGSSRTWSSVNGILSQSFNTVAIDLRGWGDSTGPSKEDAYSIALNASDVEAVIAVLGLQKFILVGLSMGAKVSQLVAGRQLQGLQGVVLVSPAPPTPFILNDEMREQQIHAYDNAENARFVADNVLTASSLPEATVSQLVDDMLRGNRFAKAAWPAHAMAEDISSTVGSITVPVLIVAAEEDVVEPLEGVRSKVQGLIPGSEIVVLKGSGHLSPIEKPEEVAQAIKMIL